MCHSYTLKLITSLPDLIMRCNKSQKEIVKYKNPVSDDDDDENSSPSNSS